MEPDLYVFACAPAGVSGAHAGNHVVGPSQGEGGGERISGGGKETDPPNHCLVVSNIKDWDLARACFVVSCDLITESVCTHKGGAFLTVAFIFWQILIELETALLDDEPHWYKLQTHDVSSIPLPCASPNTQRRQLHGESPTRRLQSK